MGIIQGTGMRMKARYMEPEVQKQSRQGIHKSESTSGKKMKRLVFFSKSFSLGVSFLIFIEFIRVTLVNKII